MVIKEMLPEHWEAVKKIYELGIATGLATFETKAPEWEEWDKNHLPHSRLVCLIDERVAGWVALSPVSGRCVYGGVAEISIYIHPSFKSMGIGFVLMEHVISESEKNGIWTLQAGIFEENKASIRLHEKSGFRKLGYRENLGKLNQQWHTIVLFERRSKTIGIS
ncbi:MAG: GNAT family N-acetyltransferase [Bacteroidetes bacterium]|nr:GNAT family N-acetyltransferase [Bacteroidota bacterium]MBU1372794.1 GNAT family N-acetyltransferase [Bacteroidota bacterium]MBU1484990.1 GNAT family N-acetyltransferase [Bacteroidota bacterium]MBU1761671.1 GNAT family N-acetyltransferase [Bacteroidota bacterium]MBU2046450.1 GNAT family N-acetyltransferase [Bacteroidota bacterium]